MAPFWKLQTHNYHLCFVIKLVLCFVWEKIPAIKSPVQKSLKKNKSLNPHQVILDQNRWFTAEPKRQVMLAEYVSSGSSEKHLNVYWQAHAQFKTRYLFFSAWETCAVSLTGKEWGNWLWKRVKQGRGRKQRKRKNGQKGWQRKGGEKRKRRTQTHSCLFATATFKAVMTGQRVIRDWVERPL